MKHLQNWKYRRQDDKGVVLEATVDNVLYEIPSENLIELDAVECYFYDECKCCESKRNGCAVISKLECKNTRNKIHSIACLVFMPIISFLVFFCYCFFDKYNFETRTKFCIISGIFVIAVFKLFEIFIQKLKKAIIKKKIFKYIKNFANKQVGETKIISAKIDIAKKEVEQIKNIINNNNFEKNEENLKKCESRLEELIEVLEKNSEIYMCLNFIFDIYLPSFCRLLECYEEFIKNDIVTSEIQKTFTKSVSDFWKMLKEETENIIDNSDTYIKFSKTANSLNEMLGKKEN